MGFRWTGNIEVPRTGYYCRLRFDLILKLVTMNDKNAEIRVAIVSFRTLVVSLIGT